MAQVSICAIQTMVSVETGLNFKARRCMLVSYQSAFFVCDKLICLATLFIFVNVLAEKGMSNNEQLMCTLYCIVCKN